MVEDIIREAMERGDFDNLPGKGKPLNLVNDPLVDPITSIVNRIIRDNGMSHPLLEARKLIEEEAEGARKELRLAWERHLSARSEDLWAKAVQTFRERVKGINREVRLFNLKSPSPALHRLTVDADTEVQAIMQGNHANYSTST